MSLLTIDEKAIEEDAKWDGFHGIAVSNSSKLTVEEALARYRGLWHVEEAFRVVKYTLKTRPIFHWARRRIKTHVLLCFINLSLERFLDLLLRQNGTPMTPDKIRYALSGVHTMTFEDIKSNKMGEMRSIFSEDAANIFSVLGVSSDRSTSFQTSCCV